MLLVIVICGTLLFAGPKEEAIGSLDTAKGLTANDEYSKAVEEINYALSKINEILAQKLIAFIPDGVEGYKQTSKNSTGLGTAGSFVGSSNALTADANYESESGSTLSLTINVGGIIGQAASFASMGQMFGGAVSGSSSIRIQGYTGTLEFDQENRSGTLTIKVGNNKSVIVEGYDIDSGDILKSLVEKMNLSSLERDI